MEIISKKITELHEYEKNPRRNDEAVKAVAESIREFGFKVPIVVDCNGTIVAGHTRYKAAKFLEMTEVPCIIADDLSEEQIKAFRLADNKTAELSEWDFDLLDMELADIFEIDMERFGFDDDEVEEEDNPKHNKYGSRNELNLYDRFIVPPFSTLDARKGQWQERKRAWKDLGLKSEIGRDEALLGKGLHDLAKNSASNLTGTSIFDPVLCEVMLKWFCPADGMVFDPFAGGSVRGIVAAKLGYRYVGIDLRQEQIDANYANAKEIGVETTWYCDDSLNADQYIEDDTADFILSCPPYADLEVYSDDPRDISTMDYDDFLKAYRGIIAIVCRKLRQDRFAVFVVGDVRDKKGFYRNFVDDTKAAFRDCGMLLYNDLVLLEQIGTGALRAGRQFSALRKVVKCHQNVLVFYKGDIQKIRENFREIDVEDIIKESLETSDEALE